MRKEMKKIRHFNPMALREKYDSSYKGYTGKSPFSSFWSDNDWTSRRTEFIDEVDDNGKTVTVHICYMLIAIEPGVMNQSLMDELKNKNEKVYERFRASQAYDELDKAMQDYETSEEENK